MEAFKGLFVQTSYSVEMLMRRHVDTRERAEKEEKERRRNLHSIHFHQLEFISIIIHKKTVSILIESNSLFCVDRQRSFRAS